MEYPLTKNKRYYFPRLGQQVAFLYYDESGLAVVTDDDSEIYYCHETHLMDIAPQKKMTAQEIIDREA